jgi:hypothetical protein
VQFKILDSNGGEGVDVVFWIVTPFGLVELLGGYQRFGGTCRLYLHGEATSASHPRRPRSTTAKFEGF